jgi:hypothetical protein
VCRCTSIRPRSSHVLLQIFLPLNRQALLVVLTECVFQVPEFEVVKAVKNWTVNSVWVQKAYSSAPMPRDQVHVIMQHTDPFCLTNLQFDELTHPPETSIYNRWTYQQVRLHFGGPSGTQLQSSHPNACLVTG